jgi:Na+/H+ antiporter NhaD/arsenite permease-like protein
MKRIIFLIAIVLFSVTGLRSAEHSFNSEKEFSKVELIQDNHDAEQDVHNTDSQIEDDGHGGSLQHTSPPGWTVIPFVLLLVMIATGPLFYRHFWHKNYPIIAVILATGVILYYLFVQKNTHGPVDALAEYVQFIALIASLYIASSGIMIKIDKKASPWANVLLLVIGAIISNLIGTTGASMLLIRPFMRLNKGRIKAYHIIFFIFMVSNIGGALTPIGDPPLFLGFLKGVPFTWTLTHNFLPWIVALSILAILFYWIDRKNVDEDLDEVPEYTGKTTILGSRNFIWLAIIIAAVFIDPHVIDGVPAIHYDGLEFSFIREIIMLTVAFLSYKFADKKAILGNEFNFEPIKEVAFIFIGIFGTMTPALELVSEFASSETGIAFIHPNTLYWGTGILSGFLDNAPTYLNFFAAALASKGGSINNIVDVQNFAAGGMYSESIGDLLAISIGAVFFGAMTYIGNGPNFMIKSIAEQGGVKMPSFFGYILRYSIPILLPIFFIIWLIFFIL